MRKLLYLLMAFVVLSCSDDDNQKTAEIPPDQKFVSMIDLSYAQLKFSYNADNNITEVNLMNVESYNFEYEGNLIKTMNVFKGGQAKEYVFAYDNGIIVSMTVNGAATPIIYNAAEKSYNNSIFLNEQGDIRKFINEGETSTYLYDMETKGVYTNTNNVNVYLLLAKIGGIFPVFCNTHQVKTYHSEATLLITPIYERDANGFPTKITLDFLDETDFTGTFSYVQR